MSTIDSYLRRIREALDGGDRNAIRDLADEIHGAYTDVIPTIGKYDRDEYGPTETGLKQLRGKLIAFRDSGDEKLYGSYGLSSITDSIRQLEDALSNGLGVDKLQALYDRIDHIYANTLKAYTDGLCGWHYSDDIPGDDQTLLRIEKLRHYRDEEYRKLKLAEASKASMTQIATNTTTSVVSIDISLVNEQIDELPDDSLSEKEKTELKGLIAGLTTKDEDKRKTRLQKILGWLSNKGVDVAIAVLPYVIKAISPELAS